MSITVAATATAFSTTVAKASPSSSSTNSTLARFSSCQFPTKLSISGIRSRCLNSKTRSRSLTVVASQKQTYSSLDELLEKSDKPVLVDFYATWCGPCQFMVPILEQVSASIGDKVKIVKIDSEKYPVIADKYKIEALPTFILFKDGKPSDRFEGALSADQLIQRIETSLEVKQ